METRRFAVTAFLVSVTLLSLVAPPQGRPPTAQARQPGFSYSAVAEIPPAECEALVALYDSTGGANWHDNTGWLDTDTPCDWYGVECGAGHVTALHLSRNNLSGSLPSELGDLADLIALWLYDNQLTGTIPPELGDLSHLQTLFLSGNQLGGGIPPQLGNLADLIDLWLHDNQLDGPIPPELGGLAELRSLHLANNQLADEIPSSLGSLARLETLSLWGNQLTGNIPPWLGDLTNLVNLWLSDNQLDGPIPSRLGDLAELRSLYLGNNQLTGEVPADLGQLARLETLSLPGNQLDGPIPPELGGLAELRSLHLANNQLADEIPSSLGSLARLETLSLWGNQLTGNIPPGLGDLTNLVNLWLNDNHLDGPIPSRLGDLAALRSLNLASNQLTDEIPSDLGRLARLEDLSVWENHLTGSIPQDLGRLTNLRKLWLTDNQLTGSIPCELGDLTNLEDLHLNGNQLTGSIPGDLGYLVNLDVLSVSRNDLSGRVPSQLGYLTNLQRLALYENERLTGPLPVDLTNLTNLTRLWFQDTDLCEPADAAFQSWLAGIDDLKSTGVICDSSVTDPILTATPASVPADGVSTSTVTLSNAPTGHQVHLVSSRRSVDTFTRATGTVNGNGEFSTCIRSSTPGTALLIAQDLTTGQTFATSAQVEFTGAGIILPPTRGPVDIVSINSRYPLDARYLEGIPVHNRVDVTVDWKTTSPGRVDFSLNGVTYSELADASGASHTFDMGHDLRPGQNSLRIVAYSSAGQASNPQNLAPFSVPAPIWLSGLRAVGAIAPLVLGGSVSEWCEYTSHVKIPPGGLGWDTPGFGPPGTSTELGFFIGGGLKLPLTCNAPVEIAAEAGVEASLDLLSVELGGELVGSGSLEGRAVRCEIPTISGNVRMDVKVYGQKNWPVLVFVVDFIAPGVGETLEAVLPHEVLTILGEVYLQGNLSGFYSAGAQVIAESPYLEWEGISFGGGPGVETGYQFDKLGVTLKIYLGASGSIAFANPNPLRDLSDLRFDHVTISGEAGYTLQVFWWEQGEKLVVEWRYPPEMLRSVPLSQDRMSDWRLIGHSTSPAYATFQARSDTFQPFAPAGAGLPPAGLAAQAAVTSVLISDVYTYPEPSLAVNPATDHALLLWVHDDVAKPVGQAHEIAFSRWDGAAWSVPGTVTDDNLLDGAPEVAWAGDGNAVAVWGRLDGTLPITATWDVTAAREIEIATSVYSPTAATWSPVALLTTNAALDFQPQLARNSTGNLLAVWRQNPAGLLSGTGSEPDRVVAAFYGEGWGAPTVAVDDIPGLVDLAAGYGDGVATIAYTRNLTPTGQPTPTMQLFTSAWDGVAWGTPVQRTDDALGHGNPRVAYNGSNQPLVVWLAGDELRVHNLTTGSVTSLTLPDEIGGVDEFQVVQDGVGNIAAVFTAQSAQRDLYVAFYDQAHDVWGHPAWLTNNWASEAYPAPALDSTGRLLMGYASTAIAYITRTTTISGTGEVVTYSVPTEGQTDLLTLSHVFTRNLTLADGDLAVSDDHPAPGDSVVLRATVRNSGDLALDGVAVDFYDGDPGSGGALIGTATLPTPLAGGFTATLTTTYSVPAVGGAHVLYAVADPSDAIAEVDETDNIASLAAFGPDLEIAGVAVEYWGGNDVGLRALIRNAGTSAAPRSTLAFYRDALTGTLAVTDVVPALTAGQSVTMTTPWDHGPLAAGTWPLVAAVNQGDFAETFITNNALTFALGVWPDLLVSPYYLWTTSPTATTVLVTATVHNVGAIAATDVMVGFYGDDWLDDRRPIFTRTIPSLGPAGSATLTGQVDGPLACTLYVYADPKRAITETTHANNLAGIGYRGLCQRVYLPLVLRNR